MIKNLLMNILQLVFGSYFDMCWNLFGPDEFAFAAVVCLGPYMLVVVLFAIATLRGLFYFSTIFSRALYLYFRSKHRESYGETYQYRSDGYKSGNWLRR